MMHFLKYCSAERHNLDLGTLLNPIVSIVVKKWDPFFFKKTELTCTLLYSKKKKNQ